jgi:hypothetical protein
MLKRYLLTFFIVLGLGFVFTGKALAAVDITLEDDKETGTLSVIVNSNESYVDGIDMGIVFSEDVTVIKATPTEGFCSFGGNATFDEKRISIECFNDGETEMDGVLATVVYQTESEDYFFYTDQKTLDIGSLILGDITNINKPEEITMEETAESTEEDSSVSLFDTVSEFLTENALYVLAGVITLIAVILAIGGLTSKKE